MSIQVGTDSYLSVAEADEFHQRMNNPNWDIKTTAEKETALVKATIFMEQSYQGRLKGNLLDSSQPLNWPRSGVEDLEGRIVLTTPKEVKDSVALLALKSFEEELLPDLEPGGALQSFKLGPLEKKYFPKSDPRHRFSQIEGLMRRFLNPLSSNRKLVRC
ncbi:MAG: hypothetical protein OEY59_01010 [Deltaproteobacteria bacterium]|nr:hypothetical protein [Deltaproteobacteria bacterium]